MYSNGVSTGEVTADELLAAVGELVEQSLTPLSDAGVVELLRGVECAARMLVAVQHRVLIEVDSRSIPADSGAKTIKRFLMETLPAVERRSRCEGTCRHADGHVPKSGGRGA